MAISMDAIKQLREETGAGIMDAKKALEESGGNLDKARVWIEKNGLKRADKKADRDAAAGVVYSYIHHDNQSGSLVELRCETDFVARTDDFVSLAKELAMQVTSNQPESVESFLSEAYNRDAKKTIEEVIKGISGKVGEKIELKRFVRFRVGE